MEFDRRTALTGSLAGIGLAGAILSVKADAATRHILDVNNTKEMLTILAKLQGDLSGRTVYSFQRGQVFGLISGQGLPIDQYGRRLYDYEGASVGRSRILPNGDIETKSRSWLFYTDPATGSYITTWHNPITGADVAVPPFRGGISGGTMTTMGPKVSANFSMESSVFNRPIDLRFVSIGDRTWVSRHAFTRWTPRGSTKARTEMTLDTWVAATRDITNPGLAQIPATSSWTSQTEWQTWLQMPDTQPGQQLWRADGMKVARIADLPPAFVAQCQAEHGSILTDPIVFE